LSRNRRPARLYLTTVLAGAGAPFGVLAQDLTVDLPEDLTVAPAIAAPAPLPVKVGEEQRPQEKVLFEADSVLRETSDSPIIAEGNVSAYFGERYLRADKLIYNPATDVVIAEGNVAITDANLETAFAGRVELSGDLRDGIIDNFSALLADNARLAADSAVREQGARTRLNRAVYTACNVCDDHGEEKTPTWRVKALRVTRDEERKVVRFHHAFFEIKGVPILYIPFIQTPDPSVERQSGFLTPNAGASSRLGFNFELPYYLGISNSQDATITPKFTTNDGILVQGEYRRRGANSYHVLAGGVIDSTNQPEPISPGPGQIAAPTTPGVRWHYFGKGYENLGENWRASYDLERVSDRTYLRFYDVERDGDLRQTLDRGRTNRLRSNARIEWNKAGHRLSVDSYLFQGLRDTDDASLTPYVLPLIDYSYTFADRLAGGRTSIRANIASLQRSNGVDTRRFTTSAFWEKDVITKNGHRFNFFAEARADAYFFQDLDQGTEICTDAAALCAANFPGLGSDDTSEFETRLAPSAGVEWSYPLARDFGSARIFLEPRIQIVASPANKNPNRIINEDSQSIEFDYAGLFDYNKATGYDAFEDGQRINAGLAASIEWPNGLTIEAEVGEQFRLQETNAFDLSSGLGETASDIVGSVNIRYGAKFGLENRFRIDDNNGSIQRAESLAYFTFGRAKGNVSYVRLREENVIADLARREELTAAGQFKLTDHWSIGAAWRLDLEGNRTIVQDFTIGYQDECSTFGLTLRRDRTQAVNLQPDTAVLLSFTLRSLVN